MHGRSYSLVFALVSLTMGAFVYAPWANAAEATPTITFKPAAESVLIGDSLPLFVIIENPSETVAFTEIRVGHLPTDLKIEPAADTPPPSRLGPGAKTVMGFRVSPGPRAKPGKYTLLFDFHYQWRDAQGRTRGPVQTLKDFPLEVKSLQQAVTAAPTVNATGKASADTLREGEALQVYLFIENKSPIPLSNVTVTPLAPPFISVVESCDPAPCKASALGPFATRTSSWTAKLKSDGADLKYGKHTLFFDVQYQWSYGDTAFASRTLASVEISSSFFGSEAVSQVFGIPLNLIVYVLPGFCLLAVYRALTVKLLAEGQHFTPTSKDGLFYSILCSVVLIFLYKLAFQKELYLYFTLTDLVEVSVMAALLGAVYPGWRFAEKKSKERAEEARRQKEEAGRFRETDDARTCLIKALSRQPDPKQYEEGSVKDGDGEWRGIVLSRPGEETVLGSQLTLRADRENENVVTELLTMLESPDRIAEFIERLRSNEKKVVVEFSTDASKRVRYTAKDGKSRDYGEGIKILDSKLQLAPTGNVIYLVE
jgi:hypothetical protein